jgi:hypothetical protein
VTQRLRETIRTVGERTTWSPPLPIVRSEVVLGLMLFALILAIIVFGPAQSYRFYYGPQF